MTKDQLPLIIRRKRDGAFQAGVFLPYHIPAPPPDQPTTTLKMFTHREVKQSLMSRPTAYLFPEVHPFNEYCRLRLYIHILICLFAGLAADVSAQVRDSVILRDSVRISLRDLRTPGDTTPVADSIPVTLPQAGYPLSANALDAEVDYNSRDSTLYKYGNSEVHLYGDAIVKYRDLTLMANYIVFNLDSSIAVAQGYPDSTGQLTGFPQFESGNQSFTAYKLRYNFSSEKGMIYQARTEQGDLHILGEKTKFVGSRSDTADAKDLVFSAGAIITTCDAEIPHYGIRSRKIKTIPNELAVIGPSNLEIHGVPTPLWLPFGFFPVTSSRRSGLLFPKDYEYSDAWGFGLRDVGYYFPINDYMDARVLGDIYFNGSWALGVASTYRKRYAYNGSINIGYSARKTDIPNELDPAVTKSFSIRITHNQDAKAHPYRRLGGSINIQTNDYQSLNRNDANSVLTSVYTSNFSWSRTFPGKPYSLSLSLNHSQNTNTKEITVDAPNLDFRVNRIYPFKNRNRVGKEKWYEKIGFTYSGSAKSKFFAHDSTFFSQEMWDNAQYGVQHRASTDMSISVLKYFHITPSASYDETWFFKTIEKEFVFNPETDIIFDTLISPGNPPIIVPDTISYGRVMDKTRYGFTPYRRVSTGISLTTQIYGTAFRFEKGWLRGVRHVIKPSISFNYTPDIFDRFRDSVQTDIRRPEAEFLRPYSIFEGGVYSATLQQGDQMSLGYSFNNIFEAKYFSRKDSTTKKLKLFDNIIVSGNYNFAALGDSLHFSPLNISGTTRFFKGASTFGFSAMYDFYEINPETGRRIQQFAWNTPGQILRFDNFTARLSTRLTIRKIREILSGKTESSQSRDRGSAGGSTSRGSAPDQGNKEYQQFFSLFDDFSIDHNIAVMRDGRRDTTIVGTNSLNMRGSLHITQKWSINVGNIGYDFKNKTLTYPDIGFTRDLHCWTMSMSWQPQRGTYSLRIGVKPGSLDFIKIPHSRNQQDTFGGF